jgi:hypothetical protein
VCQSGTSTAADRQHYRPQSVLGDEPVSGCSLDEGILDIGRGEFAPGNQLERGEGRSIELVIPAADRRISQRGAF